MLKKIIKSNDWFYNKCLDIYYFFQRNNIMRKIRNRKEFYEYIDKNTLGSQVNVFSLLEPNHGNLGDIALANAHKNFIKNNYPEYNIIEVLSEEIDDYFPKLKRSIEIKDIIVLVGGGSIGDYYSEHEKKRSKIIRTFKDNKIISFPQSIYFSNTRKGKKMLENSKESYRQNDNLYLYARDKISFDMMKEYFKTTKVRLTPDIVLSQSFSSKFPRKGAKLFLRSDLEGMISNQDKIFIKNIVEEKYNDVFFSDTKVDLKFKKGESLDALTSKMEEFQRSEIVVTDRLHGMIFAITTSTPCIVLSNYNHKIKAQYDWVKSLNFVEYCDDLSKLPVLVDKLSKVSVNPYTTELLKNYYNQIVDDLEV